jgi:hypothetical protein
VVVVVDTVCGWVTGVAGALVVVVARGRGTRVVVGAALEEVVSRGAVIVVSVGAVVVVVVVGKRTLVSPEVSRSSNGCGGAPGESTFSSAISTTAAAMPAYTNLFRPLTPASRGEAIRRRPNPGS